MGTAQLFDDGTKAGIRLNLDRNDRVHVSVEFIDDATQATNTGKLVKVSSSNNPGIDGWINTTPTGGSTIREMKTREPQYVVYPPTGSTATYEITVWRSDTVTNDPSKFIRAKADAEDRVTERWHDSDFAVDNTTHHIHIRRWTFTEGENRVIVTIVMQDDEGGGSDQFIGKLFMHDNKFALRIEASGQESLLSVDEIKLTPLKK